MSQKQVLVLMTSYNGERYIKQQIESIIQQSFLNWKLVIQDDGSSDSTVEIVQKYCEKDSRIELMYNKMIYHGAYNNFHYLINRFKQTREFDYVMFCDQDDIWLQNKMEDMVRFIEKKEEFLSPLVPILCYADMDVYGGDETIIYKSLEKQLGLKIVNKNSLFFSHIIFGCNTIFNISLFDLVPKVEIENQNSILSHDNYYAKYAAFFGEVFYIPQITMHYRRHGMNVTSNHEYKFSLMRIINRVLKIEELARDHALTYNQSIIAINSIVENYPDIDTNSIRKIAYQLKHGGITAVIYIMKNRISWGKTLKSISHILIIFSKKYQKYLIE